MDAQVTVTITLQGVTFTCPQICASVAPERSAASAYGTDFVAPYYTRCYDDASPATARKGTDRRGWTNYGPIGRFFVAYDRQVSKLLS